MNDSAPVFVNDCAMYICHICQARPARVMASCVHIGILNQFDMTQQELYTASGHHVSMYVARTADPPLSARAFSTQCFLKDLDAFTQVMKAMYSISPAVAWHS